MDEIFEEVSYLQKAKSEVINKVIHSFDSKSPAFTKTRHNKLMWEVIEHIRELNIKTKTAEKLIEEHTEAAIRLSNYVIDEEFNTLDTFYHHQIPTDFIITLKDKLKIALTHLTF